VASISRADTDELMGRSQTASGRSLGNRLLHNAFQQHARGGIDNMNIAAAVENAETEPEIAEANMQAQIVESAQRMCFWLGVIFHSSVLATGWVGWGTWHNSDCDEPFSEALLAQNIVSTMSLVFSVIWRAIKLRNPLLFEEYISWKMNWERFNNLCLFSLFVAVMCFYGLSKECDSGIKQFTFWYFLTVVIIFPAFFCCGVCGMIVCLVWLSNRTPMGQTLDKHIVEEMDIVTLADLTENEKETGCAICQDQYDDENVTIRLLCGHVFHKECVQEWLTKFFDTCPLCRESQTKLKEMKENGTLEEHFRLAKARPAASSSSSPQDVVLDIQNSNNSSGSSSINAANSNASINAANSNATISSR